MKNNELLNSRIEIYPQLYAYSDEAFPNQLKIGSTTRKDVTIRISEQYPINRPRKTWKLEWSDKAMRNDGTLISDKEIHSYLKQHGFKQTGQEWFKCKLSDVKSAYIAVKYRKDNQENRTEDFSMRSEQESAVIKTFNYFKKIDSEKNHRTPHFLWNAKMRFGKTFASYQLAKLMQNDLKRPIRVLILTFKPVVEDAWRTDLKTHIDFKDWQFYSAKSNLKKVNKKLPLVCFGSFQDYLGKNANGGIKAKNEWVHSINWDLIIFDEYHFGAWNENSKKLADSTDELDKQLLEEQENILKEEGFTSLIKIFDETMMPITGYHYLYLSGTPFKAISSGEFLEDQIFNWTYSDEQKAKHDWNKKEENPYLELPEILLLTYQLPSSVTNVVTNYGKDEFDLNEFFRAEKDPKTKKYRFVHEDSVQKWLDMIRGAESILNTDDIDNKKPPLPFSDTRLMSSCNHTMWFLPFVGSCDAMEGLLKLNCNNFYHNYKVINCSGSSVPTGLGAIEPVRNAMGDNPTETKTIILTCGKLCTGVTIKPLSGILMLRNSSSPETYFQSAFRIQSPWTAKNDNKEKIILKEKCYIFDFAPNRALSQVVEYASKLDIKSNKPIIQKVSEFINFLPVLQFDGATMKQVNASEILQFIQTGTNATLLAKRWQSALLVNVDNLTLSNIMNNKNVLDVIMKIEGFRSLGKDIFKKVINKTEKIKKLKTRDKPLTKKERKQLSEEEKERNSLRKQIQEKLIKFGTRIPIFMYLTDYREESLVDIIRKLEPLLFKKVTGLEIEEFELLLSYNVFNSERMNSSILQFRRYEDDSLSYSGIEKHKEDKVGLFDTVISHKVIYERK